MDFCIIDSVVRNKLVLGKYVIDILINLFKININNDYYSNNLI